jgi:hypothetical protein
MMKSAQQAEGNIWAGYRKNRSDWMPIDAMPFKLGPMMRLMGKLPRPACNGMFAVMKPMFPTLFPILLPMAPKVMPKMLGPVEQDVPIMPEYMKQQMPGLMPKVIDAAPKMLPDVVPLVIPSMIDYLQKAK